jgi:predicted helicase
VVESIAEESVLASQVKKEHPIMVVMGNPPYSGISQNKHYTANEAYKVEIGGKERLKEKKNWLDDDYVKFIRFAESMIEKNGEGVVGMITAHGYIDNPTFRGMRWHLRNTFDAIYVLDLHGNSNKKEVSPDGSADVNVFDIKTGVSILFGVKKRQVDGKKVKVLATVYQSDMYGKRAKKFAMLSKEHIESIAWNELPADADIWKVEGMGKAEYIKGFSIAELFPKNTTGIVTMGDSFIIDDDKNKLEARVEEFLTNPISESELTTKHGLGKNYAKWVVDNKKSLINDSKNIIPLAYRPFDTRYTYFDNKQPRSKLTRY